MYFRDPVLLDERVEDQSAVDATPHIRFRRKVRTPLFDHQAFAFLTGHGAHLLMECYSKCSLIVTRQGSIARLKGS